MPGPGETFAGYQLRRALGQGTSGSVYLAQPAAGGDWVALKILHPLAGRDPEDAADERARFLAEARTAQRLRHPDIVAVFAAGEAQGRLWLAMEPVPGCSLARYTEPARLLPPELAVAIVARGAAALAPAHAAGVVHRDLKPSNILVDLSSGIVKLSDFGVARLDDGSATRTGVMLGTPAYMAPEQLAGAPADARSDLYALGVILFELLAGRRPHTASAMGDFLRAVASEPAPDLRAFWPQAPAPLAELLAQLLARRPAERPGSAAAVAEALGRVPLHGAAAAARG